MSDKPNLVLIDSETEREAGRASEEEHGVVFPDFVDGWKHVMDCRPEPYDDKSIEENCHLAAHVRKPYILIEASSLETASDHAEEASNEGA